jgi:hypothetical protein
MVVDWPMTRTVKKERVPKMERRDNKKAWITFAGHTVEERVYRSDAQDTCSEQEKSYRALLKLLEYKRPLNRGNAPLFVCSDVS